MALENVDFGNINEIPYRPLRPGIDQAVFAMSGDGVNVTVNRVDNGNDLRPHTHDDHQQIAWILQGECDYYVDGQPFRMTAGSWVVVPKGVEHYIHVYDSPETVVNVDIFAPAREDYNEAYSQFLKEQGYQGFNIID
ncbi:cupin domain-containing protein [Aerococcus urinaeequi]|uniref:cupin domain-containing protein n=1 Tax=Aerococcus urinaeequi TaxID=51665 RepID=UPI003B3AABE1